MPYIKQENRTLIDSKKVYPRNAGELNYAITQCFIQQPVGIPVLSFANSIKKLVIQYIRTNGLKYQQINDVIGALNGVWWEARRRLGETDQVNLLFEAITLVEDNFYHAVVGPYEDEKIQENGELYTIKAQCISKPWF